MNVRMYVHVHVYTHIFMYIYIYAYTHIRRRSYGYLLLGYLGSSPPKYLNIWPLRAAGTLWGPFKDPLRTLWAPFEDPLGSWG